MRKKWIHAIRRDEGKDFEIKPATKVCSRHFREYDIKKTLAGKFQLRHGAVALLFAWTRTSPQKRKAPTLRESGQSSKVLFKAGQSEEPEEQSSTEIIGEECGNKNSDRDSTSAAQSQTNEPIVPGTEMEPVEVTQSMDKSKELDLLKQELLKLKSQLETMKRQNEHIQSQLFDIERFRSNDSVINFYTGFPNWNTFIAIYNFLSPGDSGQNIKYWLSANANVSADFYDK